ncbi:MAG: SMP-30/gluconolactonase/LRE family protein, partial [Actinomycetota bacterium]|nr:SMP-30/gluconolactonase/LRE family protein [Actinomycetota bacterium]
MNVGNAGPRSDVELVLDAHADLGEGPTWDPVARQLLWVDITAGIVHRFDPATGTTGSIDVGQPVGAAVPTTSGHVALAVRDAFSILDPVTRTVTRVADVEAEVPETMMNDGKCDPAGRFWAGTKDVDGHRPLGSLYRFDA